MATLFSYNTENHNDILMGLKKYFVWASTILVVGSNRLLNEPYLAIVKFGGGTAL